MNLSQRELLARELEKAELVYRALVELGGRATIDEIARHAQMPREEAYYIMTKLNERGFLVRERDETTLLLYFRVVREFKPEELLGVDVYIPPGEPEIYARARRVKALIDAHGLRADLIGSCKVHLATYPYHKRLTVDIDVVTATESEADELAKLLVQSMKLKPYHGLGIDYKLEFPDMEGGVDVSSIGIKKSKTSVIWGFWKYFKSYRGLLLELAVVGKLMRPYFSPATDGYDVVKGILYSDIESLVNLTRDAYIQADIYALDIGKNLEEVLRSIKEVKAEAWEVEMFKRVLNDYKKASMKKIGAAHHIFSHVSEISF